VSSRGASLSATAVELGDLGQIQKRRENETFNACVTLTGGTELVSVSVILYFRLKFRMFPDWK
jgi:hypothetical protein